MMSNTLALFAYRRKFGWFRRSDGTKAEENIYMMCDVLIKRNDKRFI